MIELSQARRLALASQFPAMPGSDPAARALAAVEHLGYVQIDTISVVQRAHHHTFWSRDHSYTPELLHEMLATNRSVFEYWGHAACYLPMNDYRFYIPLMRSFLQRNKWFERTHEKCRKVMPVVLKRIREEGPLASRDFENPKPRSGQWWNWKPAKRALEMLLWLGELMVTRRDGFQRVYNLTERVLPSDVNTAVPTDAELARFCVQRALRAHTLASEKTIVEHLNICNCNLLRATLKEMAVGGELDTLRVDGIEEAYLALPGTLESMPQSQPLRVLGPFDNACIHRKRLLNLLGFDYKLESYTPATKRRWGYFTLPILDGERFVGRIDAKAERGSGTLLLRAVHFEADLKPDEELVRRLALELHAFRRFNGCETWTLGIVTRGWKQLLGKALRSADDA